MKKIQILLLGLLNLLIVGSCIWLFKDMHTQKEKEKVLNDMKLVLYEGPKSLRDATEEDLQYATENQRDMSLLHCTDTLVFVNDYPCYVYDTNVNHNRKWVPTYLPPLSRTPITYFDFEGSAKIKVIVPNIELESVIISPLSYDIKPSIDKASSTVSFTIDTPDTYTLMFNGEKERALHIFANSIEEKPDFASDDIIYIGPGEWDIESITLESGKTLYIDGGAVVHGIVNANYAENVKVLGRGIIDGSGFSGWKGSTAYIPLKFDNCKNVELDGVICLNPNAWVCQGYNTDNLSINNIKIVSARPNGDGITIQSCENVNVSKCFVRSWDDSLVVKNYSKNSSDIYFKDIQIWTDLAQSMEVGYETNKGRKDNASITNVTFENITVLHNYHKPIVSVHNADDALVSDILFKNIIVEDEMIGSGDGSEMPYLIDLNIAQNSNWSSTKERGTIENVTIEGLTVMSGSAVGSRINGFDATHKVKNIAIKNINILGEKIDSFEKGNFEINSDTTENLCIE